MGSYKNILYEKKLRGVQITLNRPRILNALNEELWDELDDALEEAQRDAEIRAVVLTGAGGVFSTGEDISGDDRPIAWPYGIPENSSLVHEYDRIREQDRKGFL
ncbi:MAG: enoyl-CoA hydratase/isomerase family protein, partial [Deltaproteobacteria bacterium]|nr:enoyl-CoA hydratase/isomerase family protein [Deltaproteobacteria bacterium]